MLNFFNTDNYQHIFLEHIFVFFIQIRDFDEKGRGVVAAKDFNKGDFVVEYSGDLIDVVEAKMREERYSQDLNAGCYMYYFKHNDQQYW